MKLSHAHLILAALAGVCLAGCGKRGSKVDAGNRDQVIHIGNLAEPVDLDPHVVTVQQDFNIVTAIFEGLVDFDPKTAEPVASGAERWETSADNLTWTFHLRKNAKWSNGDPVTAHDYVFAYRRILSPALGAQHAQTMTVLKNGAAFLSGKLPDPAQLGVRAADDHTLVLTLERPVPHLLSMMCNCAWYPLHRATIEKFGKVDQRGTAWTRPENIVTNGAFTLKEWKPHQFIRQVKSETYWDRDKVKLKEVYWYPIESEDAEERTFRAGQLHVTSTMPITKIATYKAEKSPYYHPHQVPAGNFCPPDLASFTSNAKVSTDLAAAKKLLAEAGFPDGKGFPKLDILFNTNEGHRSIAEAVQQMWKRGLGIDVGLYNQEGKVWSDSMRSLNYQIARWAWIGDFLDPSTFLGIMTSDDGNNQTGWKNAEYDKLIAAAANTGDQAKRYEYFQRCADILAAECPLIPIYFYNRNNLRRPEVKGWYGNVLDQHPLKGVYLDAAAAK
jgi:oligopeptide transport system substrate-binding protein